MLLLLSRWRGWFVVLGRRGWVVWFGSRGCTVVLRRGRLRRGAVGVRLAAAIEKTIENARPNIGRSSPGGNYFDIVVVEI